MRSCLPLGMPTANRTRLLQISQACGFGDVLVWLGAAAGVVQDARTDKPVDINLLKKFAHMLRTLADLAIGLQRLRIIGHDLDWHQASPTWRQPGDRELYEALYAAITTAMLQGSASDNTSTNSASKNVESLAWAADLFERASSGELDLRDPGVNAQATACYQAMYSYVLVGE